MPLMENTLNDLAFGVENASGCNERPAVLRALRDSAREFCRMSEIWVRKFLYRVEEGITTYDAAGAEDAFVHRVISVRLRRNRQEKCGQETEYELLDGNTIRIDRELLKNQKYLEIESVLLPNPGSVNLPGEIVVRNRDALVYGACARLMRQAGKPWFSMEMAEYYQQKFFGEIQRAIADSRYEHETESTGFSG